MATVRDYGLPLLLALLLHALVAAGLWQGWNPDARDALVMKPKIVNATLRVIEPPKRRPPPPKPVAPAPPKPAPAAPTPAPKPAVAEQPPPPKVDPEEERRQREEQERLERLQRLQELAFDQAIENELSAIAEDDQDTEAMSYIDGIYESVVANWSRPPSARNDMQAKLFVELIPTGEVIAVTLAESSGNTAFDRSAEAAVRKARRFEVPAENALFEKHFRRFTLLFKPEDLLR